MIPKYEGWLRPDKGALRKEENGFPLSNPSKQMILHCFIFYNKMEKRTDANKEHLVIIRIK